MRYRWIAAAISGLTAALAMAAIRPHYGGMLRVETTASGPIGETRFATQIYETLVRSDSRGEMQPWLATAWSHDPTARRWLFSARKKVILHNGEPWTPGENTLITPDSKPLDEMLAEDGQAERSVADSGPFRVANLRAGEFVRLEAHEGYWGGRPFLDAVDIQMGRTRRDQLLDFELGKADVVEGEISDIAALQQRGKVVQVSKPLETVALVVENVRLTSDLREAVALSIDRVAIQRVLLDKQGEISGALLPEWISGYSFLFPSTHDIARARGLAQSGATLLLCVDARDKVLRSIADRIAVDAGQAGLTVRQGASGCDVRLVRLAITSVNPQQALLTIAAELHVAAPLWTSAYGMERDLLRDHRVVPLFHLPLVYVLGANVRNWSADWNLADVWLEVSQ